MLETLVVKTHAREQLLDLSAEVRAVLARSGAREGLVVVYSTHTTAAITLNENADPDVPRDMLHWLRQRIPQHGEFVHAEGNSDAHLKTSLFGVSQTVVVHQGRLMLGRWQGIFLAEFDGPRTREVLVKVVAS
ncbi:MAG TPA: secondary thiamine-phosphate synthase enzyme YjbQ [Pantanalinema sp.]